MRKVPSIAGFKQASRPRLTRGASHPSVAQSEDASQSVASWESSSNVHHDYPDTIDELVDEVEDSKNLPGHMKGQPEHKTLLNALEQEENDMIRALRHAYKLQRRCRFPSSSKDVERFHMYVEEQDFVELNNEVRRHRLLKAWFCFDAFFGILVIVNAVLFGLSANGNIDESEPWVLTVQSAFVVLFAFEYFVRWYYHPKRTTSEILHDPWMIFDLVVLVLFALDVWLLGLLLADNRQINLEGVQVSRVLRLLRLLRLVRLLKLLQDLWVLVRGMSSVAEMFLWSVLALLLIIYSYALIITALVSRSERLEDRANVQLLWGTVARSMLSLAELSTFNGSRRIFLAEMPNTLFQCFYCFFLLTFLSMSTFGISNLIVGVMLTATVSVEVQTLNFEENLRRLKQHDGGLQLRERLLHECHSRGISNSIGSPHLSKAHLLRMQSGSLNREEEDTSPPLLLTSMSGLLHPEGAAANPFERAGIGKEEIDQIFGVHASSGLGPAVSSTMSVDQFIEACLTLTGSVHQIDVHSMLCGFGQVEDTLRHMLYGLKDAEQELQKTANGVKRHIETISLKDTQKDLNDASKAKGKGKNMTAGLLAAAPPNDDALDRDAERVFAGLDVQAQVQELYTRFDMVFCIFIVANAALVAYEIVILEDLNDIGDLESTFQSESSIWLFGEMIFLAIFGLELFLRLLVHNQISTKADLTMYWKIFPRAIWTNNPVRLVQLAVSSLPELIRDPSYCLEIIIWLISAIDILVLTWVWSGDRELSSWLMPIKVARLIRLLRMHRLITLVPELKIIIHGVALSAPMLFWAVVVLLVTCYTWAVIMVGSVGQAEEMQDIHPVQADWGTLDHAIMVLFRVCTLSDWGRYFEVVGRHYWWAPVVLGIFLLFAGLTLINMVTGVMVRSTFRAISKHLKHKEHTVLLEARQALLMTRDILEDTRAEAEKKHKKKSGATHGPRGRGSYFKDTFAKLTGKNYAGVTTSTKQAQRNAALMGMPITVGEVNTMLQSKRFRNQLLRAELRPDEVILLFWRLNAFAGQVTTKAFLDGLMRLKYPVASTDVAQSKSVLRRQAGEFRLYCEEAEWCQDFLMDIMERLHGVHLYQSEDIPDTDALIQEEMQSQRELQNRIETIKRQNNRQRKRNESMRKWINRRLKRFRSSSEGLSEEQSSYFPSDDGHED